MRKNVKCLPIALCMLFGVCKPALTQSSGSAHKPGSSSTNRTQPRDTPQIWVGTWAASQQIPEPENALPSADLMDATLRETVRVSCGGSMLRVHLSNAFGTRALHLTSVHIARPTTSGDSAIDPASDRTLLFDGSSEVIIPPGAEYISDAISYPLVAISNLTISMHVEAEPGRQTGHPGSRQTTFYAHGDMTAAPDMPRGVPTLSSLWETPLQTVTARQPTATNAGPTRWQSGSRETPSLG